MKQFTFNLDKSFSNRYINFYLSTKKIEKIQLTVFPLIRTPGRYAKHQGGVLISYLNFFLKIRGCFCAQKYYSVLLWASLAYFHVFF